MFDVFEKAGVLFPDKEGKKVHANDPFACDDFLRDVIREVSQHILTGAEVGMACKYGHVECFSIDKI